MLDGMDVAVQLVTTWWARDSRGGAGAARRNALPTAFPLPDSRLPLTHVVTMREEEGFEPCMKLTREVADRAVVQLREADGRLRVMLVYEQFHEFVKRRPPAVRIEPGQWLRWRMNYRSRTWAGRGQWNYRLDTLNVAYGPDVAADVFLGTPAKVVDERALLY